LRSNQGGITSLYKVKLNNDKFKLLNIKIIGYNIDLNIFKYSLISCHLLFYLLKFLFLTLFKYYYASLCDDIYIEVFVYD
jgi:hypothetical protein